MTDPTPPACPICRSSEPAVHGQVTSAADIDAGYPSRICRNAWHDCEPVTGPTDTDPRIDAACKAAVMARTSGACDGFPNPCDMCDCFWQAEYADQERDVMRRILAAADAVDPLRAPVVPPTDDTTCPSCSNEYHGAKGYCDWCGHRPVPPTEPTEPSIAEYKRLMHMVETYTNTREPLCPRCHWPWRELPICANPGFDHQETCARYRHALDVCADCEAEMAAETDDLLPVGVAPTELDEPTKDGQK